MKETDVTPQPLFSAASNGEADAAARLTGHVRLRTLIILRWLAVAGQTFALVFVHYSLGFPLPLAPAFAVVAASAWLNIFASFRYPTQRMLRDKEAALYLGYDILQLSVLLFLTGGIKNPFALLFFAPVTISGAILSWRATVALGALALACITLLSFFYLPLPWTEDETIALPSTYLAGIWTSLVIGIGFTAAYAWRVAAERTDMSDALAATQLVLAREQKLSALGGLAAAAAHELGTPLATIQLTAKEMKRELGPDHPFSEDAALLVSQAERCRDILGRLSLRGDEGDIVHDTMTLRGLLEEVTAPYQGSIGEMRIVIPPDAETETFARQPEIIYGLQNFVENAADYASGVVQISVRLTDEKLHIAITDDGPGFAPEILPRLGEPYVTTREAGGRARGGPANPYAGAAHEGLGLGFFIATTLLERTGARITFANRVEDEKTAGAEVSVIWPRTPKPEMPPNAV